MSYAFYLNDDYKTFTKKAHKKYLPVTYFYLTRVLEVEGIVCLPPSTSGLTHWFIR